MIGIARTLPVLLAVASAGAARPSDEEFHPTPDQLREYHAVYENGDVKYLRTVFDRTLAGKGGPEGKLLRGAGDYLARKFIVMSRDTALYGGTEIAILFQGKADALFQAWIYDRRGGANRYELRGFRKLDVPEEELARMRVRYRPFLEDPEHAM